MYARGKLIFCEKEVMKPLHIRNTKPGEGGAFPHFLPCLGKH
jgi:hypothetical protein